MQISKIIAFVTLMSVAATLPTPAEKKNDPHPVLRETLSPKKHFKAKAWNPSRSHYKGSNLKKVELPQKAGGHR
ncbi:hypothetical protein AA313_de0206225 [Arthrobotrys entomopaga]|nr:hypothetical protein AA313_de0206225 [Arthrobotrys entomopaga]